MGPIVVRYPGRVCLLGEHCDWAGGSSLTVPLPLGIEIRAEAGQSGLSAQSSLDGELLEGRWPITGDCRPNGGPLRFVAAAAQHLQSVGVKLKPTHLWVQSDLPAGRGFSSSAAFTLGVLDALSRFADHALTPATLAMYATIVERDLLQVPCGPLDPAACAAGQPLFLRWTPNKDGGMQMHTRRISPHKPLFLVVGVFDAPRDAPTILRTLNTHHGSALPDSHGDAVREALVTFGAAAERGARAMTDGDLVSLGSAMNEAQQAYESHLANRFDCTRAPRLLRTCRLLRDHGALGAKFSGAGGDGSVVALFSTEEMAQESAATLSRGGSTAWSMVIES